MDIRKLQRLIVDALEDVKGQDIKVYNTTHLTELFDRVIIASGTSNRQTKALASSVRDAVKSAGGDIIAVEGTETGEWVLVDCGDAVVHILQPQLRLYYNLEEIWGDKPVRLRIDGTPRRLVKADAAPGKPAAAAPKPGARAAAGAAAAAKRKAAPRKAVSRTVGVKRSATASAAAKTAAPRKSAVAKTPVKAAVKAAGKTPARSARRKA